MGAAGAWVRRLGRRRLRARCGIRADRFGEPIHSVESGLSDDGKEMLAEADIADVTMAPAADMFELGVKVQVLGAARCSPPAPPSYTRRIVLYVA